MLIQFSIPKAKAWMFVLHEQGWEVHALLYRGVMEGKGEEKGG